MIDPYQEILDNMKNKDEADPEQIRILKAKSQGYKHGYYDRDMEIKSERQKG